MNIAMKPEDVTKLQMACPLSVGQAEAGRWTFCLSSKCMAWRWKNGELKTIKKKDKIPEGWELNREVGTMIEIREIPTHGYCGMIPLEKE